MRNIGKNITFTFILLMMLIMLPSCELMEKEKEDDFSGDAFFTDKLPPHPAVRETMEQETVKVAEKASVVKEDVDGFEHLADVKKREVRKQPPPFYEKYLKGKPNDKLPINLDLDAESIHNIIPAFAAVLGFSYAVDPAVKGAITLKVQDPINKKDLMMPRREVWKLFEQILWMAGAYCSPEGEVLHIMPFSKMPRERRIFAKKGSIANVEVRIIDIRNVAASTVLSQITDFLTEGAKATELTGENSIMIVEAPENMRKLEQLIKLLDNKHRALWPRIVIRCINVSSGHITEELSHILPVLGFPVTVDKVVAEPGAIHLTSIKRLQTIVASAANKEALDEVVKWVSVLDRSDVGEQEQVFVYKVINSKAEELIQVLASIFTIEGASMSYSARSSSSSSSSSSSGGMGSSKTSRVKSSSSKNSSESGPANIFETPAKIFADGKNNRLIVRTTPRTYTMIKALLCRLDTIPAQVLLQVMIAEVRLNEGTQFGVEFSGATTINGKRTVFGTDYAGLVPGVPSDNNDFSKGFQYLISSGTDQYAYLRGMAGTGDFKILASPQLAAISGTEASLDVGQEVPIVTRTISDTNSGSAALSTSNEVEYKKTGVLLKITPQVTKGGLITIELDQMVSARGEDVPAGGQSYPSFINRQVITSLSMRDGSTLFVGGIIQETNRSQNDSLPFISKIPTLATILGYNNISEERTELLIMITASIISEKSPLQKMIGRYKQSIKTIKDFNKSIRSKKNKSDE